MNINIIPSLWKNGLLFAVIVFTGCASYKELRPAIAPLSEERGVVKLTKRDNVPFYLNKGNKYFISFPPPESESFYLVIKSGVGGNILSSFTADFDRKSNAGNRIYTEKYDSGEEVYTVKKDKLSYYWLIDSVINNLTISPEYRFVPQWRFKMEKHHARYSAVLLNNRVERNTYNNISQSTIFDGFQFDIACDSTEKKYCELSKVKKELDSIAALFPPNILNSSDSTYRSYLGLKEGVKDEIDFQRAWITVLKFHRAEVTCRHNPIGFLDGVDSYISFFTYDSGVSVAAINNGKEVINKRVAEILPLYESNIAAHNKPVPFDSLFFKLTALNKLPALYRITEFKQADKLDELISFIKWFNEAAVLLFTTERSVDNEIKRALSAQPYPPSDFFVSIANSFRALLTSMLELKDKALPEKLATASCVESLKLKLVNLISLTEWNAKHYQASDSLVKSINTSIEQENYSSVIHLLKKRIDQNHLYRLYPDIDEKYITQWLNIIKTKTSSREWSVADSSLTQFFADKIYLYPDKAASIKKRAVNEAEEYLYNEVEKATRERVALFCEERIKELENIDSLYADSVFFPVYDVTFTSGDRSDLLTKKNELSVQLEKLKKEEFPASAINLLYESFVSAPEDNGVMKCRAIVAHSRYYKGNDADLRRRVAECDPSVPKPLVKAVEYRRINVLPITDNRSGNTHNTYLMRVNLKVESEAKFPVFDINIKLPKEVAQNAAEEQWYESITLNGKPLKNEGRFSISAPTKATNWECQITPVQTIKDGNNILEIKFRHRSFKVFSVSVMAQKPIIKKN